MKVKGIFSSSEQGLIRTIEQKEKFEEEIAYSQEVPIDGMVEAMTTSNIFLANAEVVESAQEMYDTIMTM